MLKEAPPVLRYEDVVELQQAGYKAANELLAQGYKLLGIYQGTAMQATPENSQFPYYVRRGPIYVLGRYTNDNGKQTTE